MTTLYVKTLGWNGVLVTAWLGTPIHELGHAAMAWLFGHRVVEIKFFQPDRDSGVLGYVNHSWNRGNLYHEVGNFFIGAAPLISGGLALWLALRFLLPDGPEIFAQVQVATQQLLSAEGVLGYFESFWRSTEMMIGLIFTGEHLTTWQFYLFLYLSLCIAAHIPPSPADMEGVKHGLFFILLLLFLVNVVSLLLKLELEGQVLALTRYTVVMASIFFFAVLMSMINLLISWILLGLYALVRYRVVLHPF
jgi:hypothetical protein